MSSTNGRQRKALADALAGVIASLVSLWSFYPIDTFKTNVQANTYSSRGLYRGVFAKSLHAASSSFCYFYIYSWISSRRKGTMSPTLRRLILSAVAAMLNTCLTLPLDVLSAKQQTASNNETMDQVWKVVDTDHSDDVTEENDDIIAHEDEKKEDTAPAKTMCAHPFNPPRQTATRCEAESLTCLWKGLSPSLLLCSNPSIHYTVFDSIKSRILQGNKQNFTMAQAFLVGLFAKFVATMATYPLIRTKILLMVTTQKSMMRCLSQEYQRNGIQGWYQGCYLQLFHTLLKSALLMMVRERITVTTHRLLVPTDS